MSASAQHHRGIDDVTGAADAEELAGGPCLSVVQGDDVAGGEQVSQPGLATPVPPDLTDDTSWDGEGRIPLSGPSKEDDDSSIVALEAHQGPGIERETG